MSSDSSKTNETGVSNLTNLSRRDATEMGDRNVDPNIGHGKLPGDARESANTANDAFYKGSSDPQSMRKIKQNMDEQQDPFNKKPEEKK